MRVLCVNSIISEFGGAEFAAINLARELARRGHDVHFLGAEGQQGQLQPRDPVSVSGSSLQDGVQRHYRKFPRIYPLGEKHGSIKKLIWHMQDIAHPENERQFSAALAEIRPDIVLLHTITAIGTNIWRTIARANIPCIQVVHELSSICLNMAQFRSGHQCEGLCLPCRLQMIARASMIKGAQRFAFVSPSKAILQHVEKYMDLSHYERRVIPNANKFLVKDRKTSAASRPELLYVGRIDPAKGIEMLLEAAARSAQSADFVLNICGSGSQESPLRQRYERAAWVRFHGSVEQETIAELMSRSTALLIPSLWLENAPTVVIHALFAGLPVIGSDIGGIPEHVLDGRTGALVPPGDVEAWSAKIADILRSPDLVASWSAASLEFAKRFDPQDAVSAYETLMNELVSKTRTSATG